jgi:hypothetical protein
VTLGFAFRQIPSLNAIDVVVCIVGQMDAKVKTIFLSQFCGLCYVPALAVRFSERRVR